MNFVKSFLKGTKMNIEILRNFFMWCTIINFGILMVWWLSFLLIHDWMQRLHGRWFHFPKEHFDAIHYAGMAFFKLAIFIFNLVPFIALCIID